MRWAMLIICSGEDNESKIVILMVAEELEWGSTGGIDDGGGR